MLFQLTQEIEMHFKYVLNYPALWVCNIHQQCTLVFCLQKLQMFRQYFFEMFKMAVVQSGRFDNILVKNHQILHVSVTFDYCQTFPKKYREKRSRPFNLPTLKISLFIYPFIIKGPRKGVSSAGSIPMFKKL